MRHTLAETAEGTLGTLHAEATYLQLIYHFPVSERAAEMLVRPEKPAPLALIFNAKLVSSTVQACTHRFFVLIYYGFWKTGEAVAGSLIVSIHKTTKRVVDDETTP